MTRKQARNAITSNTSSSRGRRISTARGRKLKALLDEEAPEDAVTAARNEVEELDEAAREIAEEHDLSFFMASRRISTVQQGLLEGYRLRVTNPVDNVALMAAQRELWMNKIAAKYMLNTKGYLRKVGRDGAGLAEADRKEFRVPEVGSPFQGRRFDQEAAERAHIRGERILETDPEIQNARRQHEEIRREIDEAHARGETVRQSRISEGHRLNETIQKYEQASRLSRVAQRPTVASIVDGTTAEFATTNDFADIIEDFFNVREWSNDPMAELVRSGLALNKGMMFLLSGTQVMDIGMRVWREAAAAQTWDPAHSFMRAVRGG